jgi:MoaA/NifB/PqqE/SkfB family radical SAM enzyme
MVDWLPGFNYSLAFVRQEKGIRLNLRREFKRLHCGVHLAQLVVIRRCNLKCSYCNEYDTTSEPVPKDVLKDRVKRCWELGTRFMEYTGGEPLLHPDIVELVEYMSTFKFAERWVITNGYLLTREIIEGFNSAGLTHMQISIDGVEPNENTVKVLRPLRKKLDTLAELARFKVQVNAALGSTNLEEAKEVHRFSQERGFIPRFLIVHGGDGQIRLSEEMLRDYEDFISFSGKRAKESKNYRYRLVHGQDAPFKCRAGARYLYIDENGIVHRCSQSMEKFKKPLESYTWSDLKEQFYTYKPCNAKCTIGCARTASRFDEWRSQPVGQKS